MSMMILVTAALVVVLVYEAVPMIRQAQWGELLVLCFLWLLGLSLAVRWSSGWRFQTHRTRWCVFLRYPRASATSFFPASSCSGDSCRDPDHHARTVLC